MAKITEKWIDSGAVSVPKLKSSNAPVIGYIPEVDNVDPTSLKWVEKTTGTVDGKDVKVSVGDTTPGFLEGKILVAAGKLSKTKQNAGANETLFFTIGADVYDKTVDDTDDITEGTKKFYADSLVQTFINSIKGAANQIASLDANGQVPISQIPEGAKESRVVATIAARDLLNTYEGLRVHVIDASDDVTVAAGGAGYIHDGLVWIKQYEAESMDMVIYWADIQNKPTSSIEQIDAAVTHSLAAHAPSDAQANFTEVVEVLTLTATDITNKFKNLANTPAFPTAAVLEPVGGPQQQYSVDFTIITDGSTIKRLNWNSLGLDGVLAATDKLMVRYSY